MPDSEEYRKEVQTRIQDLLSGRRERDPHLSSVSKGRLILEGIVEEAKIYRMHKEEEVRKAREQEQRWGRRMRHRSRERHPQGHRHRADSRDKYRDRSRERRRDRAGDGHRERPQERGIPDPVTEGPPQHDWLMTGGAGPKSTFSPDAFQPPDPQISSLGSPKEVASAEEKHPHDDDARRQRSGSRHRHRKASPTPGRVGASRSPPRRKGPDGTPFGELPKFQVKKGLALGFGDHFMKTYKHIKAEHDAGHRSKGVVEKKIDDMRRKKTVTTDSGGVGHRDRGIVRRDDQRGRSDGMGQHVDWERKNERKAREVEDTSLRLAKPSPYEGRRGDESSRRTSQEESGQSNRQQPYPEVRVVPPTSVDRRRWQPTPFAQGAPPPVLQSQPSSPTTPPAPIRAPPPAPISRSSSVQQESRIPSIYPMSQAFTIPQPHSVRQEPLSPHSPPVRPAPPPPSYPPPAAVQYLPKAATAAPGGLLSEIHRGMKLRQVKKSEQPSESAVRESQPVYEETPHSRDVEANEHAQAVEAQEREQTNSDASNRAWSSSESDSSDDEPDGRARSPHPDITAQLGALFGGHASPGSATTTPTEGSSVEDSLQTENRSLIAASRTSMNVNISTMPIDDLNGDNVVSCPLTPANLIDDGVFSELAAHIAKPSWDWSSLSKSDVSCGGLSDGFGSSPKFVFNVIKCLRIIVRRDHRFG
ncbi:uncharacterized protein K460DRAFT_392321 [Cucurbitaria berberidis CBS 394.84]|uniref:WH2 domain-containing protein n=1 Tax=Cucurbitaria berberidis CBS 394.84 TaxID=1168544 RepID=A0A9P4GVB2_9PLEO|nr:uncharacterized protein K460DRAFT_392321 [Cucurbitaria berberidis CBS 394.84]KAF1852209.1 hypothetical protein K460DRAFT_392321 [Cucurbitaria berberidis CBS 394.84]